MAEDTKAEEPARAKKEKEILNRERYRLLYRLEEALEMPLILLGFVWLVLIVIDLVRGLNPFLTHLSTAIWIIFILDFLVKFILAPSKKRFLKKNIITMVSLAVPALRVFRLFQSLRLLRSVRAVRGLRFVKILGSLNRGMRSLNATLQRRAIGYMLLLTCIVMLAGAAGMYAFEREYSAELKTYGDWLWWTAMQLSSLGGGYAPASAEGKLLSLVIALYGFVALGYFTATLASWFVGQDAESEKGEIAGSKQIGELKKEVKELRKAVEVFISQQQRDK